MRSLFSFGLVLRQGRAGVKRVPPIAEMAEHFCSQITSRLYLLVILADTYRSTEQVQEKPVRRSRQRHPFPELQPSAEQA